MARPWLFALLALLLSGPAAAQSGPVTVYRGATLIDGTGAAPRRGMAITVEGERIVRVAPAADPVPKGAAIVDVRGLYVLPGLIDSHVHLASPPNRKRAEAEMRRWLYGGVTAVRDMADDTRAVGELARRARSGDIAGPDIGFAALMAGPSFFDDPRTIAASLGGVPGKVPWMQAITPRTDLIAAVAAARGTGARAIKIYANLSGETVAAITAEAHRQGLLVWAHAMVFPATPTQVIDAGVDGVSHICYLAYQFNAVKPGSYAEQRPVELAPFAAPGDHAGMAGLFAAMKARHILLDPTLRVYAEEARRGDSVRRCPIGLAERLTLQAWRAGVAVSAGTDGFTASRDPWPSLYEELVLLAKAGMPPLAVIHSATEQGAVALGWDQDMGTVAVGKLANLLFVRKNPAADLGNLRSVVFVVKRGKSFARRDYGAIALGEIWGPE